MFAAWLASAATGSAIDGLFLPDVYYFDWAKRLDQYQQTYYVYEDCSSPGNHFQEQSLVGASNALSYCPVMKADCREQPYSGSTCIRCEFRGARRAWGGWLFLNGVVDGEEREPHSNWGDIPNAGCDLRGATELSFWARGRAGGERVEFFCGGIGRGPGQSVKPYPDSLPRTSLGCVTLSNEWRQYRISLEGKPLDYVINGFGWYTTSARNGNRDIVFYLDEIQYNLRRPGDPRFLASYKDLAASNRLDVVMRNVAFTRDNAVAILTFLAHGDRQRAQRIADALVYAQQHDRFFEDGRLRNAYQAGDIALPPGWTPHGRQATARIPGWYDPVQRLWLEDKGQVGTTAGDMAWAILALVEAGEKIGGAAYLNAAQKLGRWVIGHCRFESGSGGFITGVEGWEPKQAVLSYRSTQENFDLFAAFERLYGVTHSRIWRRSADHALRFLLEMRDPETGQFHAGIDRSGVTSEAQVKLPSLLAARPTTARNNNSRDNVDTAELPAKALPANPQAVPTNLPLKLDVVADGFTAPVVLTHAGDGSGRLFVAEQTGQILIVNSNRAVNPIPFLDLSTRFTNLPPSWVAGIATPGLNPIYEERGLLGLAFHPAYRTNGRFFVYYTAPSESEPYDQEGVLAEYRVSDSPDLASTGEVVLLRIGQPEVNHNGGSLAFGPDGCLYLALGDGGGGSDDHGPIGNGQDLTTLLGSVLRINVDKDAPYAIPEDNPFVGAALRPEIYAYGFRDPHGISFDRSAPHRLALADSGERIWEEVNFVEMGGNYGWRMYEGTVLRDEPLLKAMSMDPSGLRWPVSEYGSGPAGLSVIGGFFYRGAAYPALNGKYVYGLMSVSHIKPDGLLCYIEEAEPGHWNRHEFTFPGGARFGRFLRGFGQDEQGELYVLSSLRLGPTGKTGDIRRLKKPSAAEAGNNP